MPPLLLPAGCSGRQARGLLWGQKEGRPRREASHSAAAAGEDTRQWSRTVSAQAKWLQWGKASGPDHRSHPCRRQAGRKTGRHHTPSWQRPPQAWAQYMGRWPAASTQGVRSRLAWAACNCAFVSRQAAGMMTAKRGAHVLHLFQ